MYILYLYTQITKFSRGNVDIIIRDPVSILSEGNSVPCKTDFKTLVSVFFGRRRQCILYSLYSQCVYRSEHENPVNRVKWKKRKKKDQRRERECMVHLLLPSGIRSSTASALPTKRACYSLVVVMLVAVAAAASATMMTRTTTTATTTLVVCSSVVVTVVVMVELQWWKRWWGQVWVWSGRELRGMCFQARTESSRVVVVEPQLNVNARARGDAFPRCRRQKKKPPLCI